METLGFVFCQVEGEARLDPSLFLCYVTGWVPYCWLVCWCESGNLIRCSKGRDFQILPGKVDPRTSKKASFEQELESGPFGWRQKQLKPLLTWASSSFCLIRTGYPFGSLLRRKNREGFTMCVLVLVSWHGDCVRLSFYLLVLNIPLCTEKPFIAFTSLGSETPD